MLPVLKRFETYLTRNGTGVVESIDASTPRVSLQILERRMCDRAIVYVLRKTGVRGAEVFTVSRDETKNSL
nr:hypothetical protein [Halovivax sp. KZCA124]